MDLASLTLLLAVAKQGSFASVARSRGVDPSSISRAVAAIEAEIGLRLFERSTRKLAPTEAGERFLDRIAPLLEEVDAAVDAAKGESAAPAGTVRLTASVAFGQECLVPLLSAFLEAYPNITLDLTLSDAALDLVENGIDLAIRLAPGPEGDLIAVRLMRTRYLVCAAPSYTAAHPTLTRPMDLADRACLRQSLPDYRTRWRFRSATGAVEEVPVTGRLILSNPLALRAAARGGLGPALLADWLVRSDLDAGTLVNLFPGHDVTATEFDTGAYALYPSRRYLPAKTRVTLDFFKARLPLS